MIIEYLPETNFTPLEVVLRNSRKNGSEEDIRMEKPNKDIVPLFCSITI